MTTIETPAESPLESGIEIRLLSQAPEMAPVVELLQQVWGSPTDLLPIQLLMAISHAGGYVSAAYDMSEHGEGRILGASAAILARHLDKPALHSHITGLLPGARHSGLGRAMKFHQRAWAAEHDIDWIVWTYDPLVRANAWFNLSVLGAEVHEYLPSFYGTLNDSINAGDETDRLLVAWPVIPHKSTFPFDATGVEGVDFVPTPEDVVTMRRTNPTEVQRWRRDVRRELTAALDAGRPVLGFTPAGEYIIGAKP